MKKIRKSVPLVLCVAFFVVTLVILVTTMGNREKTLLAQSDEIASLKSRIATIELADSNKKAEYFLITTGMDMRRVSQDNGVVADFMRLVCTWDSYDEYMAARVKIMQTYNIEEDSHFMSIFMPKIVNRVSNDGKNYNRIDTMGLNMTYEGLDSYVTKIVAGEYSYFTIVSVSSTWENGGEAIATAAITYTVDAEGNLSNIWAIPLN